MFYDQKDSGMRIAELRKQKGLTQEQLAEQLNISTSMEKRTSTIWKLRNEILQQMK